ncbi:hypothetical protein [Kistimonas asteriae]|uniref:hypothetical protein n=1 Tax=Kistimonas asteriae TaxID=517724 RepID=UPI001BAD9508|nr:hypothetical protein [Kistimonas asteriae]
MATSVGAAAKSVTSSAQLPHTGSPSAFEFQGKTIRTSDIMVCGRTYGGYGEYGDIAHAYKAASVYRKAFPDRSICIVIQTAGGEKSIGRPLFLADDDVQVIWINRPLPQIEDTFTKIRMLLDAALYIHSGPHGRIEPISFCDEECYVDKTLLINEYFGIKGFRHNISGMNRFLPCFCESNDKRYKMYFGEIDVISEPLAFDSELLAQTITNDNFPTLSHEALNDNTLYFCYTRKDIPKCLHFLTLVLLMENNEDRGITIVANEIDQSERVIDEFMKHWERIFDEHEIEIHMCFSEKKETSKIITIKPFSQSSENISRKRKRVDFIDPFPITNRDFHRMTKLANTCTLTGDISFSDAVAIGKLPLHEFSSYDFYLEFYKMVIHNSCTDSALESKYKDVYFSANMLVGRDEFKPRNMKEANFPLLRTTECRDVQKRAVAYLREKCSIEDLLVKTAQSVLDPGRKKPKWMNKLTSKNVEEVTGQEVAQCGVTRDDSYYYDFYKMVYEKNTKLLCDKEACLEDERFWPN